MMFISKGLSVFDNFVWGNPSQAAALFAGIGLLLAFASLLYLIVYTRRTTDLRDEAAKQTRIQSDSFEASVMPLLIARFGQMQTVGNLKVDAVLLENIGNGPALGVQVEPLDTTTGTIRFDYIPVIKAGESAALICVQGTPEPSNYDTPARTLDVQMRDTVLVRYARYYILGRGAHTGDLKVVTKSLSNTVHEFFSNVELRGSDHYAVLVYKRRNSIAPNHS